MYATFQLNDLGCLCQAIKQMELCTSAVKQWMTGNKLNLNDSKSELMINTPKCYHVKILASDPAIQVSSDIIKPATHARNLGATFDCHMTMNPQTNNNMKGVHYHLQKITKI